MDAFLIILLVVVGIIAVRDKGIHRWLAYAWFTILGLLLGWVGMELYLLFRLL